MSAATVQPVVATEPPVLSWPARKFRDVFRAMLIAASTDPTRPHLSSVYVGRSADALKVAATNGFWMLRRKGDIATKPIGAIETEFVCLIPRNVLERFLPTLRYARELENVSLWRDGARWRLQASYSDVSYGFRSTEATYPDLDSALPKTVKPTIQAVGLTASVISDCARAFARGTGRPTCGIFVQPTGGPLDQIAVTTESGDDWLAIVMPRRMDADACAFKPVST